MVTASAIVINATAIVAMAINRIIAQFISVSYDSEDVVARPGQCKLCTCCSSCVQLCNTCVEEDEEPFESLLRVIGQSDNGKVRAVMQQMIKECEEEKEEEEEYDEDLEDTDEEFVISDGEGDIGDLEEEFEYGFAIGPD